MMQQEGPDARLRHLQFAGEADGDMLDDIFGAQPCVPACQVTTVKMTNTM